MTQYVTLWTLIFATLVLLYTGLRLWLDARQMRHVAQHRASVPAPFAQHVELAAHQKAADYTRAKLRLGTLELVWSQLCLLGWTLLGGLHAVNTGLLDLMGPGLWQSLALFAAVGWIQSLLDLPLSWWRTFRLEAAYGFNRSTVGLWLGDLVKGWVMGAVVMAPLAALVLWLMDQSGNLWWLYAWAAWVGFSLLMLIIYPTWIAPRFNNFEPLANTTLSTAVTDLMRRCGFAAKGLYVMDGSKRSAHANAYFTGLGKSKRVVFYDTLIARLSQGEMLAVLAHELGHFKRGHVPKRMITLFGSGLLALLALSWLAQQPWFYLGLGVMPNLEGSNSALALILFFMVAPMLTLLITPWMSARSRRDEFEADAYAAEHAQAQDLGHALVKLYKDNASTLTPDPIYVRFFYSHPPALQRLERLNVALA
jgi:STE24 endopeptidase